MEKYGAKKPGRKNSNRSNLSLSIQPSRTMKGGYRRKKIPKVPNKYSSKGAFSKSYSNVNLKYYNI
jgi:hypothetical protein